MQPIPAPHQTGNNYKRQALTAMINPGIQKLQPYPFEKLAELKAGLKIPQQRRHINLSVGEPRHSPPSFIAEEILTHLHGISRYPATRGELPLRQAIAAWLTRRYNLASYLIDPDRHVLPVNGTREALFAFAQCIIDATEQSCVLMPNPFYQIYEGAAYLAGAEPWYVPQGPNESYLPDIDSVPNAVWQRCRLIYLCNPANPAGTVMDRAQLQRILELSDRYGFVVASDECYSEIYLDEDDPPPGLLQVAAQVGNTEFSGCIVFHSLSKRSNVPGLRSGFVAGDQQLISNFLRYRTYHGCAMPLHTQAASGKAWADEEHVRQNRVLYRAKFDAVIPVLETVFSVNRPAGGFYLWPRMTTDDRDFARELYRRYAVTVVPGQFLSRRVSGYDPGANHIRMALVAPLDECIEAAHCMVKVAGALDGEGNN